MPRWSSRSSGGRRGKGPRYHIGTVFKSLDTFGKEVPAFNIAGETRITTSLGGIFSIIILISTAMYAILKFVELSEGSNPNMSENMVQDYYSPLDKFNIAESGFKMAFSIENYLERVNKDDSRYVKWIVRVFGKKDNEEYEKVLPFHKCTDEDFATFNPVAQRDQGRYDLVTSDPDRGLYCFD